MVDQNRWAVLVCRYKDDTNDPNTTTIAELAAQWRPNYPGVDWLGPNWDTNTHTILDHYQRLFTATGRATTNNMPNFYTAMSHGNVVLDRTVVLPCLIDYTSAQAAIDDQANSGKFQTDNFHRAKVALQQQWGLDPRDFYALIVSFQFPDWGSQGGNYDGGPGVYMDVRYTVNNGSKRWGHEMGHAFGLDHSRADANDPGFNPVNCRSPGPDYRDPWDAMSAECCYGDFDPDYGAKGPGFNAWNMRSRRWLDETRVWHCPDEVFSKTLTLRPLHRRDLPGFLAAELPPMKATSGLPKYLVEFRLKADWDSGLPRSCVQIHRLDGSVGQFMGTHSYVQFSLKNNPDMTAGDIFVAPGGPSPIVRVLSIDEAQASAVVRLSHLPDFIDLAAAANLDGRIEVSVIAADAALRHFWQTAPNGGWTEQFPRLGAGNTAKSVAMIRNGANQLEIVYVGTDDHIYHNWQTVPNGNWSGEKIVNKGDQAKQVAVASDANGNTLIAYRGTNDKLYVNAQSGDKSWKGEHLIGTAVRRVGLASNADHRLELCFIRADGQLCHRRQAQGNDYETWQQPETLFGDAAQTFGLAAGNDRRLEILYVDAGNRLKHSFQTQPAGAWGVPEIVAPFAKIVAVSKNRAGLLELFFTDQSDVIWHLRQTAPQRWERAARRFAASALQMSLIQNQDGRLELIYRGADQQLYHDWEVAAPNSWHGELPF